MVHRIKFMVHQGCSMVHRNDAQPTLIIYTIGNTRRRHYLYTVKTPCASPDHSSQERAGGFLRGLGQSPIRRTVTPLEC